jgi:hypothetical protein
MIPDGNRALMVVDETKAAEIAFAFAFLNFLEGALAFLIDTDVEDSSNE